MSHVHQVPHMHDMLDYAGIPGIPILYVVLILVMHIPISFWNEVIAEDSLKVVEYGPRFLRLYHMLCVLRVLEKSLQGCTCHVTQGCELVVQYLTL